MGEEKITAKDAAKAAAAYFRDITDYQGPLNLEEVELTPDEKYWLITLAYEEPKDFSFMGAKKYKLLEVDTSTGEVVSMKIRAV